MEDKEREEILEELEENFEKMEMCNEALKEVKKILNVVEGEM